MPVFLSPQMRRRRKGKSCLSKSCASAASSLTLCLTRCRILSTKKSKGALCMRWWSSSRPKGEFSRNLYIQRLLAWYENVDDYGFMYVCYVLSRFLLMTRHFIFCYFFSLPLMCSEHYHRLRIPTAQNSTLRKMSPR